MIWVDSGWRRSFSSDIVAGVSSRSSQIPTLCSATVRRPICTSENVYFTSLYQPLWRNLIVEPICPIPLPDHFRLLHRA